ncbi:dihydrofolate reductase family protein [Motilibacter deserti]|uniref:Dihydrofolate reductase n=1 Tax=Motilibacter deserti TaxID=2714956 RepID=A0ABX0GRG9_9ACTN|nr:dihydrofolate reductase family protein [Motilibacter deserti]NHC12361.1 dihydrofolate reductase [Motilibacter deserti]
MRKVVVYELMALDGVGEEPGDWMFDVDEAVFSNIAEVVSTQDTVLMGRGTYDYWAGHWPHSDLEPFASFINRTPKHVFTSRPLEPQWENSVAVSEPLVGHVRALKETDGREIGVHASLTIANALLRAELVDELRLVVAPALAGHGRALFDEGALRRLTLLDVDRTGGGALLLHYALA